MIDHSGFFVFLRKKKLKSNLRRTSSSLSSSLLYVLFIDREEIQSVFPSFFFSVLLLITLLENQESNCKIPFAFTLLFCFFCWKIFKKEEENC